MYADQYIRKSKGLEVEAHEGSIQELLDTLYKMTYEKKPKQKPNTFHNGFTYIKNFGLHPANQYPKVDQSCIVSQFRHFSI